MTKRSLVPALLLASACSSSTQNEGTGGAGGTGSGGAPTVECADAGLNGDPGVLSFISPSNKSGTLSVTEPLDATIGSYPPGKKIYYTLDGTEPTTTSSSATSPVPVSVGKSLTLKWLVEGETQVNQMTYTIDPTVQSQRGQLVEHVSLAPGSSPIVAVGPGACVSGTADWQQWTSAECPGCKQLLAYGFAQTLGCLDEIGGLNPGPYPGKSGVGAPLALAAPQAPANYALHARALEELACNNAVLKKTALTDSDMEIALVVVR